MQHLRINHRAERHLLQVPELRCEHGLFVKLMKEEFGPENRVRRSTSVLGGEKREPMVRVPVGRERGTLDGAEPHDAVTPDA